VVFDLPGWTKKRVFAVCEGYEQHIKEGDKAVMVAQVGRMGPLIADRLSSPPSHTPLRLCSASLSSRDPFRSTSLKPTVGHMKNEHEI
jgi:hypothetical protein